MRRKFAGRRSGVVVPISTFACKSHGDFSERTHMLYSERVTASTKKDAVKDDAYGNFDSILVSVLVSPLLSKRKRPEA